jgi:hypothetical protein
VNNRSPDIKFGITTDGKTSSYWRLRAGMKQLELFLEREDYGKKFHFSLHVSGQWHMKQGRNEQVIWARPDEIVPGYTRAFGIVQPVVVAAREDAAPDDVELVAVAPDAEGTTFSVFFERPGANQTAGPARTPTVRPSSAASLSLPAPGRAASSPAKGRCRPGNSAASARATTSCGRCGRRPPEDR